jgi:hypothetical protein
VLPPGRGRRTLTLGKGDPWTCRLVPTGSRLAAPDLLHCGPALGLGAFPVSCLCAHGGPWSYQGLSELRLGFRPCECGVRGGVSALLRLSGPIPSSHVVPHLPPPRVVSVCACCSLRGNTVSAGGLARGHVLRGARGGGSPARLALVFHSPRQFLLTQSGRCPGCQPLPPVFRSPPALGDSLGGPLGCAPPLPT